MKKLLKGIVLIIVSAFILVACGAQAESEVVKVGVVGERNEQWDYLKDVLVEEEGIEIELVKFTEYVQPIQALDSGDIDIHSALTEIYMQQINEESGYSNTTIGYTTLNPLGIFSEKYEDVADIPEGSTIAIPNDVSNEGRALLLLQTAGLIEIDPEAGLLPTVNDIISNPKNIKIETMAANQTARVLADVAASVINNDMAADAGFVPSEDAIFREPADESSKPYWNVIASREEEVDNETYQTIVDYYQTDEVAQIIDETTNGSSIPVWTE